jgi:hypothetical protein
MKSRYFGNGPSSQGHHHTQSHKSNQQSQLNVDADAAAAKFCFLRIAFFVFFAGLTTKIGDAMMIIGGAF